MHRLLKNKRGQTTAEYAILIALVVAAVVGMQTYVKRGLQARMRDTGDDYTSALSSDANWANITSKTATLSEQYEHGKLSSKATQDVLQADETSGMTSEGIVTRESTQRTKQAAGDYRKYDY